jgi:glycosyltransferase involved in cell wall biosynthesis
MARTERAQTLTPFSDRAVGDVVTPVILTFNEEANIERTLKALDWAPSVVVVDSGSLDGTETIAKQFLNVRWFVRPFDTHAQQWEFAIRQTGITTPYVLALDADYEVPTPFVDEMRSRFLSGRYRGGSAAFEYRIQGRPLLGSVYPAKLVIFNRDEVRVSQPGHTQEFRVEGDVYRFAARLIHDDRKPVTRFVNSQMEYSRLEASRLLNGHANRWQDRLRRSGIMPLVAGVGAYIRSGGPLRGSASLRYAYERTLFESLLALRLLNGRPDNEAKGPAPDRSQNPR